MNIPRTSTATTSTQTIDQSNTPKEEQPVANKKSEDKNVANDSKASQTLAEQSKATQSLQAEINKNQLHQLLPAVPTTTTATTTKTAEKLQATNLEKLSDRYKLDANQIKDLKAYAKEHGVPEADLIKVASNERYSGSEKVEAMKAYAISYDAASNKKLSDTHAKGIKDHVLPGLLEGKIGVRLKDMGNARARYNGLNEGNKDGYEPNTMYLPKEGLNLHKQGDRAVLVHEAHHAVQDASKKSLTFMESEKEGHNVQAEYLLRESGALEETPNGTKLNFEKFDALLQETHESTDRKCVVDQFAEAAEKNIKNGKKDLNGQVLDLGDDPAKVIRSFAYGGGKTFEELYIQSRKEDPKNSLKTDQQILEMLNRPAPKDGI